MGRSHICPATTSIFTCIRNTAVGTAELFASNSFSFTFGPPMPRLRGDHSEGSDCFTLGVCSLTVLYGDFIVFENLPAVAGTN